VLAIRKASLHLRCLMPHPVSQDPKVICESILHYLSLHPEAADSLEGIASWWLPPSNRTVTTDAVQAALTLLVVEHRIALIDLADGRTLYQSVTKLPTPRPA